MLKDIFHKLKSNKNAKTLVSNFAWLSVLQIISYIFPLITMPYLARVIGVDGFGKIAFASAVMIWMQTIADWGFNFTATRDIAKNRDNLIKVSEIFSNVLWARCTLMIASVIILIILITFIPIFKKNVDVLLMSFLMIPGHILFPDWFFQAMERMKYITVLNLLSKFLFTIAVFVFIKEKDDYILQPLLTSLGFVVSGIISLYYIFFIWKVKLNSPSIKSIRHTIKNGFDVFLNTLMPNLYNSFSTVLLGFYGGEIANGKLDAGTKFVNIAYNFIHVVSRVFFPFLSRKLEKHYLYAKMNIGISIILSLILFLFAPLIIDVFFTKEFVDSISVLRITSFSVVFIALSNVYGTNYMIIAGHERQLRNITAFVSIVGFILSFPLIYCANYIGAALTVTITRGLLGISIYYRARYLINTNKV